MCDNNSSEEISEQILVFHLQRFWWEEEALGSIRCSRWLGAARRGGRGVPPVVAVRLSTDVRPPATRQEAQGAPLPASRLWQGVHEEFASQSSHAHPYWLVLLQSSRLWLETCEDREKQFCTVTGHRYDLHNWLRVGKCSQSSTTA